LPEEIELRVGLPGEEIPFIQAFKLLEKRRTVISHAAARAKHFIVKLARIVALKNFHGFSVG
jgi:hypothetical protein